MDRILSKELVKRWFCDSVLGHSFHQPTPCHVCQQGSGLLEKHFRNFLPYGLLENSFFLRMCFETRPQSLRGVRITFTFWKKMKHVRFNLYSSLTRGTLYGLVRRDFLNFPLIVGAFFIFLTLPIMRPNSLWNLTFPKKVTCKWQSHIFVSNKCFRSVIWNDTSK